MSQPSPATTHKSPINVKNMIHTLERDRSSSREMSPADSTTGLTKSRSFNDLHLVEDDWVSLDPRMIKKLPVIPSPTLGKPPKPPARRKKMQGPAKSTEETLKSSEKGSNPLVGRPLPRRPDSEEIKRVIVIPSKSEEPKRVSPKMPPKVPKMPYPAASATQNGTNTTTTGGATPTTNTFTTTQTKLAAKTISSKLPPRPPPPTTKPTRQIKKPPMIPLPKEPEPPKNGVHEEPEQADPATTSITPGVKLRNRGWFRSSVTSSISGSPVSTGEQSEQLEETYDVIPESSSTFEDMVAKVKIRDSKLHDASIYEVVQAVAREIPHCASTKDLPASINGFPTSGREMVIHELYTTEYNYVKTLEVVVEVFKLQMAVVLGDDASQIFANVEDIMAFNRGFLSLLHGRLRDWAPQQCIGDIFLGMFTQTKQSMYAIYCSNYDNAESIVLKMRKKREVDMQLSYCLTDPSVRMGMTLPMYLITPVQRIPRYILLLKDIIKRTPDTHPDYVQLQQSLEKMGELAAYINLQIKEAQTKKTLNHLRAKVVGLSDLEEQPNRKLVKEGQVYLLNIAKLYQCILFTDILVFAHGDSKSSKVELVLPLEALWIEDLDDRDPQTSSQDAIEVYTPQRPYRIYVRTNSEKKLWIPKLREAIYHHLVDSDKCDNSNDLDTVKRTARFQYTDQRVYTGAFNDALRHGKGQMVWPNKCIYLGNWIDNERSGEGEFHYNTGEVYSGHWAEDKQSGYGGLKYASGDVYRGMWRDGLRHGKGKIIYSNGDVFEGNFHLGHIEGRGHLYCTNKVEYTGDWKQSHRHGRGILKTLQGNWYDGEFRGNLKHGQGKMRYYDGDTYDGGWRDDMRHGQGKFTSRLQGTYDGSWSHDLRHGKGLLLYRNRDEFDGFWENNKRHGRGTMKYIGGEVFVGEFVQGAIHGEGEMTYSSQVKYKGKWNNGMRHGTGTMIYEDGSVYEGEWLNDLRHGPGRYTWPNGIIYKGDWKNDEQDGKGQLEIPSAEYKYDGDWSCGKRSGHGYENSQYGTYDGGWRNGMKYGHGVEKTLVGTIFRGQWERGRKHATGTRKLPFGLTEEQIWKSGQLQSDPARMTAVELPFISRNDL